MPQKNVPASPENRDPVPPNYLHLTRIKLLVNALTSATDASAWTFTTLHLPNIRYLCNFSGSSAALNISLARDGEITLQLFTDRRYIAQASEELSELLLSSMIDASIIDEGNDSLVQVASDCSKSFKSVLVEFDRLTHRAFIDFHNNLATGVEVRDASAIVERLRAVKDTHEVALLERAAKIADLAFAQTVSLLDRQISELDFAAQLNREIMAHGGSGPSFDTIVASGPNSAKPHASPTPRLINRGDVVVVDFGAEFAGYRSDCTRTLFAGDLATPRMDNAYKAVSDAQRAGIEAIGDGKPISEIDRACRESLGTELAAKFNHGTGHGVGLDIHERPWISARSIEIQKANMVLTVEPGIYFDGDFGIRIEDTLVVTDFGGKALTALPK